MRRSRFRWWSVCAGVIFACLAIGLFVKRNLTRSRPPTTQQLSSRNDEVAENFRNIQLLGNQELERIRQNKMPNGGTR